MNILNKLFKSAPTEEIMTESDEIIKINYPEIIIDSAALTVELARWMEMRLKSKFISVEEKEDVRHNMSLVMQEAGIPKDKTVTIKKGATRNTIICEVSGSELEETLSIDLRFGDFIEFLPEMTINSKGISKSYELYPRREERPIHLVPTRYVHEVGDKTYVRYYSQYRIDARVIENGQTIKFEVKYNTSQEIGAVHTLKDQEEALEEAMLGLGNQIPVDEIYKRIMPFFGSLDDYEEQSIIHSKDETKEVLECILLKNARLQCIKIRRGDNLVTIDSNGWSHTKDNVTISKSTHGKIDYSVSTPDEESLSTIIPIETSLETAKESVQDVKTLSMNMFKTPTK